MGVVVGVELLEHGTEAGDTFCAELLLEFFAEARGWVGKDSDAHAEGFDVKAAPSHGNNGVMGLEELLEKDEGFLFVGEDVVGVGHGAAGDEVMGDGGEFLLRGTGHSDVELLVELARVAGEYFGAELLGEFNGSGGLARGGGA